jgi:DNA-directed RNA polymerase subunit RPC12/RpoP
MNALLNKESSMQKVDVHHKVQNMANCTPQGTIKIRCPRCGCPEHETIQYQRPLYDIDVDDTDVDDIEVAGNIQHYEMKECTYCGIKFGKKDVQNV